VQFDQKNFARWCGCIPSFYGTGATLHFAVYTVHTLMW